jgi:hypothetical protein
MSDILKIGSGKIAWNASGNIGIILILLGLTVIFGWHAGSTTLVSVHGSFVAMQYNAALGFVLCGIGLLARGFDWREAGYTAGALLLALSGSILVEHQFDIDLGISRFFFSEPSLALAALVSPMSEISAFCFLLAGTVLLLSMGAGHRKACRMLGGVLSVVIVAFGVVAIVGYIGGWNTAYGRSQAMGVAFHTALGFIVTGTGLFATGLDRSEWTEHWPR